MKKAKKFFLKLIKKKPFQEETIYMNPRLFQTKKIKSHKRRNRYQIPILSHLINSIKGHYLLYLLLIIIIILIIFVYIIVNKTFFKSQKIFLYNTYNNSTLDHFANMLPRISLDLNKGINNLEEIFNSREIYISDAIITPEYIKFIRPINIEEEKNNMNNENTVINIDSKIFAKRPDQYDYIDFCKLNLEEKLIDPNEKIEYNNNPLISVVLPSFNKENILLKSIRSIQNQKFKNIEIIIVDDCSTDNSTRIFKYLLETDPRVRIFHHIKNMVCWRSRLDGLLYSKGKYAILFDTGDLYEDNYVLTDAFNVIEKYNLDSCKFTFRILKSYTQLDKSSIYFTVKNNTQIVYGTENITELNSKVFTTWGNIWNRLVKRDIHSKALYLLNELTLNVYKNVYDDIWFNTIIHKASNNFAIFDRVGYVYLQDGNGEGSPKFRTPEEKSKYTNENIAFLYFQYNFMSKNESKTPIIDKLKEFERGTSRFKLDNLKSNFYILNNLLEALIKEENLSIDDKNYLEKLLKDNKNREIELNKAKEINK